MIWLTEFAGNPAAQAAETIILVNCLLSDRQRLPRIRAYLQPVGNGVEQPGAAVLNPITKTTR